MTNDEIDLFVDRMCGYWPTTNIARNTVKSTWKQSMILRDLPAKQAKSMLEKIKVMPGFPSLNAVEQLAQQQMNRHRAPKETCAVCGDRMWIEVAPVEMLGHLYSQVVRCVCYGGSTEELQRHGVPV